MEDGTLHGASRRSTPSTSRRTRSSATATRWCCPTCRPRSSRARPSWRWSSASARRSVKAADAMELHLRLHQLHRRLGARPAAAGQRLLPDEVARHLRADRPVHRHRRRDRRSAEPRHQAVEQRRADAELQHRRHGAQDPALHRVGDARSTRWSPATSWPPAPTIAASTRSWTATRSSSRSRGLGTLHFNVQGRAQAHLGARDAAAAPGEGPAKARTRRRPAASTRRSSDDEGRRGCRGALVYCLLQASAPSGRRDALHLAAW